MEDSKKNKNPVPREISESDIYQAMREMPGYVDITPDDFKEIYGHAYQHAYQHLLSRHIKNESTALFPEFPGASAQENGATDASAQDRHSALSLKNYIKKMKGAEKSPPKVGIKEICWSWVGAFLGIAAVAYCNFNIVGQMDLIMIIGSFGASAVLIYGAIKSPLAQPRNFIGGHIVSAVIGVASYQLLFFSPWMASAMAVATAIAAMHATKTLHPPGGATALIAVIGSRQIHDLGYLYVLVPVGLGALIMLVAALIVNNIPEHRKYPEFWW